MVVGARNHRGEPKTIVAVGEALWDEFPDGRRPGGAPCNVAYHAARLGDRGVIVTRVGDDAAGPELIAFLRERGVVTEYVQRDGARPTGTVRVTFEDSDPRYAITEDVAWDYIAADEAARALMRMADAVCVGSLAQRSEHGRATIQRLLSEARGQALVVFDVNWRHPFIHAGIVDATLRAADVVKLSEAEVSQLSSLLARPSLIDWLLEDIGVRAVCVTSGTGGASISTLHETVSVRGRAIDTSAGDAVGAGDAFTAAMTHQLVRNASLRDTIHAANRYASLIATKKGAMPQISDRELAALGL